MEEQSLVTDRELYAAPMLFLIGAVFAAVISRLAGALIHLLAFGPVSGCMAGLLAGITSGFAVSIFNRLIREYESARLSADTLGSALAMLSLGTILGFLTGSIVACAGVKPEFGATALAGMIMGGVFGWLCAVRALEISGLTIQSLLGM